MYKYTLDELQRIAEDFADSANPPFSILLNGEIGAGKTTFSTFFIRRLLIDKSQNVTSPTFNIVQIYDTTKGPIWHVDLYRLECEDELFNLGIIEAMHECICLIEWPHLIKKYTGNLENIVEFSL